MRRGQRVRLAGDHHLVSAPIDIANLIERVRERDSSPPAIAQRHGSSASSQGTRQQRRADRLGVYLSGGRRLSGLLAWALVSPSRLQAGRRSPGSARWASRDEIIAVTYETAAAAAPTGDSVQRCGTERVRHDVADGLLSAEAARRDYGILLTSQPRRRGRDGDYLEIEYRGAWAASTTVASSAGGEGNTKSRRAPSMLSMQG
jgi:hypothetical protein